MFEVVADLRRRRGTLGKLQVAALGVRVAGNSGLQGLAEPSPFGGLAIDACKVINARLEESNGVLGAGQCEAGLSHEGNPHQLFGPERFAVAVGLSK